MFLLRLLGGASLEDESGPLSGRATQRRRLTLLAILALEHPRPVARDKLIAWLWPEHDTERARHLLRDSLYLLRGALGDGTLRPAATTCGSTRGGCDATCGSSTRRSDRTASRTRCASTAARCSTASMWPTRRNSSAGSTRRGSGSRGRTDACSSGWPPPPPEAGAAATAVDWWQRRLATDPLSARVTLRLMDAMHDAGDRAGAIRQAGVHAAQLRRELGAGPDRRWRRSPSTSRIVGVDGRAGLRHDRAPWIGDAWIASDERRHRQRCVPRVR
jgi:DNA-binding SARP family transcriptional activator